MIPYRGGQMATNNNRSRSNYPMEMRSDPFERQMMTPFDMMGEMMNMDLALRDQFDSLAKFSGLHDDVFRNRQQVDSNNGAVYSRSYVVHSKVNQNGQRQEEKYYQDQFLQKDRQGNTISERNQAYQNEINKKKQQIIAQERMLNDRGRKFIKQRQIEGGNIRQGDTLGYYYGMEPDQQLQFDDQWNSHNQNVGFSNHRNQVMNGRSNNRLMY